jgi:hypothetical protein
MSDEGSLCRQPATGNRELATGNWELATGNRQLLEEFGGGRGYL